MLKLVSFEPVGSNATIGNKWNSEMDNILHFFNNNLAHFIYLIKGHIKVQFIVHLHNHLCS